MPSRFDEPLTQVMRASSNLVSQSDCVNEWDRASDMYRQYLKYPSRLSLNDDWLREYLVQGANS
jgi:hypothetical protein